MVRLTLPEAANEPSQYPRATWLSARGPSRAQATAVISLSIKGVPAVLTSPVQAAIAELTKVAQMGRGLAAGEFAGGDMLLRRGRQSIVSRACANLRGPAGKDRRQGPEATELYYTLTPTAGEQGTLR